MKVLLLEYITAGGLSRTALPQSLLREGTMMRDALFADFSMLENVEIVTSYDTRLANPYIAAGKSVSHPHIIQAICIDALSSAMSVWLELLQSCDAALIVAPETGGLLAGLIQMIEEAGVKNLGCASLATEIASNKYKTYHVLKDAHILAIPTYSASEFLQSHHLFFNHGCVIKPIDGAGCEDTYYFAEKIAAQAWLKDNERVPDFIVQPYQLGTPASISILCKQGQAWLLSCNTQAIVIHNPTVAHPSNIKYAGGVVNGLYQFEHAFTELANRIAATMLGLNGYVGVDVVVCNDKIYVVEINPRITTSYIGLRKSIGVNPAKLLLDLVYTDTLNEVYALPENMTTNPVAVDLHE